MTIPEANQIRLALVGPSGVGKSTTAQLIEEELRRRGLSCCTHKLAKPLYDIKQVFYEAAGRATAYEAQDHTLMEQIARSLRELSPTSLVDNLASRLASCRDDVVLNDDLRDDAVDWPALSRAGFKIVRVHAPAALRRERMAARGDTRPVVDSTLDVQVGRIRADYVLVNVADRSALDVQVQALLDRAVPSSLVGRAEPVPLRLAAS